MSETEGGEKLVVSPALWGDRSMQMLYTALFWAPVLLGCSPWLEGWTLFFALLAAAMLIYAGGVAARFGYSDWKRCPHVIIDGNDVLVLPHRFTPDLSLPPEVYAKRRGVVHRTIEPTDYIEIYEGGWRGALWRPVFELAVIGETRSFVVPLMGARTKANEEALQERAETHNALNNTDSGGLDARFWVEEGAGLVIEILTGK